MTLPMHRRLRGFTMIDLLVCMGLISVAITAVPITLRIMARSTALARTGSTALALAQAKLEELIAQGHSATSGNDTIALGATTFRRKWNGDTDPMGHRSQRLTVVVGWDAGRRHRVALESVLEKP